MKINQVLTLPKTNVTVPSFLKQFHALERADLPGAVSIITHPFAAHWQRRAIAGRGLEGSLIQNKSLDNASSTYSLINNNLVDLSYIRAQSALIRFLTSMNIASWWLTRKFF